MRGVGEISMSRVIDPLVLEAIEAHYLAALCVAAQIRELRRQGVLGVPPVSLRQHALLRRLQLRAGIAPGCQGAAQEIERSTPERVPDVA